MYKIIITIKVKKSYRCLLYWSYF